MTKECTPWWEHPTHLFAYQPHYYVMNFHCRGPAGHNQDWQCFTLEHCLFCHDAVNYYPSRTVLVASRMQNQVFNHKNKTNWIRTFSYLFCPLESFAPLGTLACNIVASNTFTLIFIYSKIVAYSMKWYYYNCFLPCNILPCSPYWHLFNEQEHTYLTTKSTVSFLFIESQSGACMKKDDPNDVLCT